MTSPALDMNMLPIFCTNHLLRNSLAAVAPATQHLLRTLHVHAWRSGGGGGYLGTGRTRSSLDDAQDEPRWVQLKTLTVFVLC